MNIINKSVFLAMALAPQILQAQGTLYFSSLNQTSTGSEIVGSDSWLAAGIYTGNNAEGYMLNSVQLGMMNDSGNPGGFTVMIYAQANNPAASFPGNSLGTLSGSSNPSTSGTYLYTDDSNIILSPATLYFIVLTAGTTIANGAYEWSDSTYPTSSSGNWHDDNAVLYSDNGNNGISDWGPTESLGIAQFAINATPLPDLHLRGCFYLAAAF